MVTNGLATCLHSRWSAWLDSWIHLAIIIGILVGPSVSILHGDVSSHLQAPRVASREATLEFFGNELPGTTVVIDLSDNASSSWAVAGTPDALFSSAPSSPSQVSNGGGEPPWSTTTDPSLNNADPTVTSSPPASSGATSVPKSETQLHSTLESTTTLTMTTTVTVTVTSSSNDVGDFSTSTEGLGLSSEPAAGANESVGTSAPTSNVPCPMLTTISTGLGEESMTNQPSRATEENSDAADPTMITDPGPTSVATPLTLLNTSETSSPTSFAPLTACGTDIWNGTAWRDGGHNGSCPTLLPNFAGSTNATWWRNNGGPTAFPITGALPYISLASARFRPEWTLMSVACGGLLSGLVTWYTR